VTTSAADVRAAAPSRGAVDGRARDPWFDNAKYALIVLVVVGHVIGTFRNQVPGGAALYVWIYAFHMPAFVFLAGFFSRGAGPGRRHTTSLFSRVLVPYLVFETLYSSWNWRLEGGDFAVSLLVPHWLMWFLLALFIWRLAAPHLERLRYPLTTSIVVALGAGLIPDLDRYLTLQRVFALLPFFVLGLVLDPRHLQLLRRPGARIVAVAALAAALPAAAWAADNLALRWFYHRSPYADLDAGVIDGLATRGAVLAAGFILTAAILALVPRRKTFFTHLGGVSMYPYLLHGFLVMGLEASGVTDAVTTVTLALLAVVAAVAGTFLLSSAPVRCLAGPFVAPPIGWLFHQAPTEPSSCGVPQQRATAADEHRPTSELNGQAAAAGALAPPPSRTS
jgi:fucose 4-O-acetylase-like acetyltransferase